MKTNKILHSSLLLILTICINNIYAQSSFKAIYNKVKQFYYKEKEFNFSKKQFTLYFKNGISQFDYSVKKEKVRIENFQFKVGWSYHKFYYDNSNNKIYKYEILSYRKTPIVAEWQNDIKWEITDETKKIGKYTVQKATANFPTENFLGMDIGTATAWFTTEIPIGTGPDGFVGLPGLIVKVKYNLNNFYFTYELEEIEFEDIKDIVINKNGIPVTKKQMFNSSKIKKKWLRQQKEKLK